MNRQRCHTVDWIANLFLIFPFVICHWRGIWDLYSYYIFYDQEPLASWVITGIGCSFVLSYFFYPILDKCTRQLPERMRFFVIRVNLYLWGLLAMAFWRGVWELLDHYLGQYGWKCAAACATISYLGLVASGTSRTLIFSPFAIDVDSRSDVLVPTTAFNTTLKKNPKSLLVYTLDSLFTHFVTNTLSIVCWRGALAVIEEIPFPNETGDFWCLLIGLSSTVILFILEVPLARLGSRLLPRAAADDDSRPGGATISNESKRVNQNDPDKKKNHPMFEVHRFIIAMNGLVKGDVDSGGSEGSNMGGRKGKQNRLRPDGLLLRRAYDHSVFLLVFAAEAFLWEGAWNLNETYMIADLMVGGWANHLLGTFVLFQLGLTSDAGCGGCVRDEPPVAVGEPEEEPPCLYPNKFVRLMVEEAVSSKAMDKIGANEAVINQSAISGKVVAEPSSLSVDSAIPSAPPTPSIASDLEWGKGETSMEESFSGLHLCVL